MLFGAQLASVSRAIKSVSGFRKQPKPNGLLMRQFDASAGRIHLTGRLEFRLLWFLCNSELNRESAYNV